MILFLVVTSFVIIFASLLGNASILSGISLLLLILVVCLLLDINTIVNLLLNRGAKGEVRKDKKIHKFFTTIGDALYQPLNSIIYALNSASWQLKNEPISDNISTNNIDYDEIADPYINSFTEGLVRNIIKRFKADAGAIIFQDSTQEAPIKKILAVNVSGARFEATLDYSTRTFFVTGDATGLGVKDSANTSSMFADFTILGFPSSVLVPIGPESVLWLGFRKTFMISEENLNRLTKISKQVGEEILSRKRLFELSCEVKQVESINKAKDEFIAFLSHDIRTPLNNIRSILSLIKIEGPQPDTNTMIESAIRNCDQMGELVEDILDFSRYQAGKLSARTEACSLNDVVADVLASFAYTIKLKGLTLKYNPDNPVLMTNFDIRHLKRILINLLGNAVKYTNSGWIEVQLNAGERGGNHSVIIRDSGIGINKEELPKLFAPFTRMNNSSGIPGVGLGLALSQVLAKLNFGEIFADSTIGKGSTFSIEVPVSEVLPKFESEYRILFSREPSTVRSDNISKLKILMVDDDVDFLGSLSRGLKAFGFDPITASTVKDAIAVINFDRPDFVISDGSMPDGGGSKLLDFINKTGTKIPCFILSGLSDPENQKIFSDLGAQKVLVKPIEIEKLARLINQTLEGS